MEDKRRFDTFRETLRAELDLPLQDWNVEDASLLYRVLQLPAFRKALAVVWQAENRDKLIAIAGCNFQTPDGITKATRLQGEISAAVKIIDLLISLADEEELENV